MGLLEQYVEHTLYQGDHPDRGRFLQAPYPYPYVPISPYLPISLPAGLGG